MKIEDHQFNPNVNNLKECRCTGYPIFFILPLLSQLPHYMYITSLCIVKKKIPDQQASVMLCLFMLHFQQNFQQKRLTLALTFSIFIIAVVNENVSLVISRQILSDFTAQLSKLPDAIAKQVAHYTLDKIHTRVISFEEQVNIVKSDQI